MKEENNENNLCSYQGRTCNLKVIENTSFCHLHILNSRFASSLGYRRCSHGLKGKRCHRPVKVSLNDLPEHLKESDLPEANESVVCGRHKNRKNIEQSVRIEDCYFDIPDSDGEVSISDHPLENSNFLTQLELAQIIKSKVDKLKKLYKSELDRTNLDLIRADRNDTKNISYHFLKQSLTGNEVIVSQLAKLERFRLYELAEDKIKDDAKSHRCHFEDCWKTAIPLTDFCLFHIKNQKNQFIYPTEEAEMEDEEEPGTSNYFEITEETEQNQKEQMETKKRKWKELSAQTDLRHNGRQKVRIAPQSAISSIISSRASTPVPQMTPFDLSSEEISRPVSPISNVSFHRILPSPIPEEKLEKSESGSRELNLSESGSSDEEENVKKEFTKKDFIPGGDGEIIDLGGIFYNINSENPTEETISLLSEKSDRMASQSHFQTSGASTGLITGMNTLDGSKSGIQIEIGTKNSKNIAKLPRMASTMKIHPAVPIPERVPPSVMMPITPTGGPFGGINQPITINPQPMTPILTADGKMLIPIAPLNQAQLNQAPNSAPTTPQPSTGAKLQKGLSKFTQGKQQSIQPQPQKLKLVGIDFFGAQEPRIKKVNPLSKQSRNLALEKLAKKAEERSGPNIKVLHVGTSAGLTKVPLTPGKSISPSPQSTPKGTIKIVKGKLGGSLTEAAPLSAPPFTEQLPQPPPPPVTPQPPVGEGAHSNME